MTPPVPNLIITLYVVASTIGGYAREDASEASITGIFTDEALAKKVAMASHSKVFPVPLNQIPPGIEQNMKELSMTYDTSSLDQTIVLTDSAADWMKFK